jgi:hypothetical protein
MTTRCDQRRDPKCRAVRAMAAAGIVAGALVLAAGGPSAGAATATARAQPVVTGLVKKTGITYDTRSSKQAFAYCDPGQVWSAGAVGPTCPAPPTTPTA